MPDPAEPLSVSHLVLRARQLEIDAMRQLAARVELVDGLGQLIHALQRERGAASIYLASKGQRFADRHRATVDAARPVEARMRELFLGQLEPSQGATERMLTVMAWVLLGLDALGELRGQIERRTLSAHDAVTAFSRLIAGLVDLIVQVADATRVPAISRLLVALLHLVQGNEYAGQERAVGAELFASGVCHDALQQRVVHLIDAQERSLQVFAEFAEAALRSRWDELQVSPDVARLERLRRTLCSARPGAALDSNLSDAWFDVCSSHIAGLWTLQGELVERLRGDCAARLREAEQDLEDSEGLLRRLRDNPPPHTHAVERFFDIASHPEAAPRLVDAEGAASNAQRAAADERSASLLDLLQSQSAQLSRMEAELEAAKRTLHERKVIERAKGMLMARLGLTEEAAFRMLQKTSMDQNRRLLEVAEATLALPDLAFGPPARKTAP